MARSLCLIITPVSLLKHKSGFVMLSLGVLPPFNQATVQKTPLKARDVNEILG